MSRKDDAAHTGGCQCGAVRYALYSEPFNPMICHCRMCQKAFGNVLAAYALVNIQNFTWTRGSPGLFKSSAVVERGFCRSCGTPLSYRNVEDPLICISIGSLDEPERVEPAVQLGVESKMTWFGKLDGLPSQSTFDAIKPEDRTKFASRQHPDVDTEEWP
jgi:hypothetical protein